MLTDSDKEAILRDAAVGSVMLFDTIERIVAEHERAITASLNKQMAKATVLAYDEPTPAALDRTGEA